ncbi:hypothetical protein NL349_26905, partial [Klebsiella pneumoniae]|nr:hypothetical protein [Klebsiella pneumoniae]
DVFEQKVRVATVLFYDHGHSANDGHHHRRGGAVPEKEATFLFKFPRTARTLGATSIELRTFDGTFSQTTTIKASPAALLQKSALSVQQM